MYSLCLLRVHSDINFSKFNSLTFIQILPCGENCISYLYNMNYPIQGQKRNYDIVTLCV